MFKRIGAGGEVLPRLEQEEITSDRPCLGTTTKRAMHSRWGILGRARVWRHTAKAALCARSNGQIRRAFADSTRHGNL